MEYVISRHISTCTFRIYVVLYGYKYSTFYALISLTEDIRKNLDKGDIGCSIFIDLQKAFDTVKHILLAKLEHYGICGIANGLNPTTVTENNFFLLMVILIR